MKQERGARASLRAVPASAPANAEATGNNGLTPPRRKGKGGGSRFISDVIVDLGFLAQERVEAAVDEARAGGRTPEEVLLQSGALTGDQLARAIAERFGLPHVDLTVYKPDLGALNLISAKAAKRLKAAPIGFDEKGHLLIAMADPANILVLDDLKLMTGYDVRPVVASEDDIHGLIGRMNRLDDAVAEAVEEEGEEEGAQVTEIRESAADGPVIKLVNSIVLQAIEDGASDVHFEPDGKEMQVRFRVDGVLRKTTEIPRRMVPGVVSRVKIMADLDIAERRVPQDGRVSLKIEGHSVDVRVVTMPSVNGEGVVMRLLNKDGGLIDFDSLGMGEDCKQRFESGFRQSYGAVLATGPTGSGKSTTLYAALHTINTPEKNIITVEDPVEYQLPGITQVQVNLKSGLTFARALRSMLRADPDVIMVGEIRDGETARIAVESALTGHLVLSTLHTNDAPSALTRLTEMGVEPFLTASAVGCVLAQRLVRQLCSYCKSRTLLSVSALEQAGFRAYFDVEAYEAVGCGRCNGSGYRGRVGLYEVMPMSDEIRALAVNRGSADEIREVAVEQGMVPLREDGFEKVKHGITSISEVARVT